VPPSRCHPEVLDVVICGAQNGSICARAAMSVKSNRVSHSRRSEIVRAKGNVPVVAVRDREGQQSRLVRPCGPRSVWPAVYNTAGAPEIMAPGSRCDGTGRGRRVAAIAGQAGCPEPLIPGCSVAGGQGSSRFAVRGPVQRGCPECRLAAPRQGPSVPPERSGAVSALCGPGSVQLVAASALAVSTSGKTGILALIPASWIVRERTAPGDTAMLTGMCSLAW
jgi:hypothetical protein